MATRADVLAGETITVSGEALRMTFTVEGGEGLSDKGRDKARRRMVDKAKAGLSRWGPGDFQIESATFAGGVGTVVISGYTKASVVFSHRHSAESWVHDADRSLEVARRAVRDAVRRECPGATVAAEWAPGSGLTIENADTEGSPAVRNRLNELKKYDGRVQLSRRLALGFAVVSAGLLGYALIEGIHFLMAVIATYPFFGLFVYVALAARQSEIRARVRDLNERLELAELLDEEQRRAHKLFSINGLELQRYYDQALRQRARVFSLGLLCILGGFAAIAWSLYVLRGYDESTLGEKALVAGLGAVSGILANFIAVVFMRMFSQTVQSMVDLHNRLVVTHHVHFGNVLTARISDEGLRNRTLAEMALALAHHDERATPRTSPEAPA